MKPTDFAYYLNRYLNVYLPIQRCCSEATYKEYCRVFTLLMIFVRDEKHHNMNKFLLEDFDASLVEQFLAYLKDQRGCGNNTLNQRLAVLHSFCSYIQYDAPEALHNLQKVIAIPFRKTQQKVMSYTTPEGMKLILSQIPRDTRTGARDLAMFSFMYDTGARVSEVCDMRPKDLRLHKPEVAIIHGKGNKSRVVPLQNRQVHILQDYMRKNSLDEQQHNERSLFPNQSGMRMTRQSVGRILHWYVTAARSQAPELVPESFSCHSIRHSTAMALLQAGVNLIYIRDILGHSSVQTTEMYLRADLKQKRAALECLVNSVPIQPSQQARWRNHDIREWLKTFPS